VSGLDLSTERRSSRPGPLDFVLLGTAVLAAALVLGKVVGLRRDVARVEADRLRAEAQAEDLEKRAHALEGRPSGPKGGLPSPRDVVELVAGLVPEDVRLVDLSLTYGRAVGIEMHVIARHPASYDLFLEHLQGSKRFLRIVPGPESRDADVTASVRAELGGGE
jgi:hypothetical protein